MTFAPPRRVKDAVPGGRPLGNSSEVAHMRSVGVFNIPHRVALIVGHTTMTRGLLHIVLGIYCTSHYIYTKIQAKFLSNQDERAPLVASEAIRVPLGHFASY